MQKLSEIKTDRKQALAGLLLIAVGIFAPGMLSANLLPITDNISLAAHEGETGYLMIASLLLVVLNTVRSLPHYLGMFLLTQAIRPEKKLARTMKNLLVPFIVIPVVYYLIERIFGIRYDFAVPAVLMITAVLAIEMLDLSYVKIGKEILLLVILILAIQFLDVFPGLSREAFGRGEISTYIRDLAAILGAERFLNGMCIIFMSILIPAAVLLGLQISLENQLRRARIKAEEDREELINARMQLLSTRMNKEQQFLVHDLKAPLTSIQIWSDLMRMKCDGEHCGDCSGYLEHMDGSISHMNMLISEIMSAKTRNIFTVGDVIKLFSSQISPAYYNSMISIDCDCTGEKMEINRTNFVRALINLTENAGRSIHHEHGSIVLRVRRDGSNVNFKVIDNGEGIDNAMLGRIWEKGVSGRNSTGVGLFFIKEVVTDLGGTVDICSTPGEGTEVTLTVPVYQES